MPTADEILTENEQLKNQLSKREQRIAELEAQIAWIRRQVFAGGKSEKMDPANWS